MNPTIRSTQANAVLPIFGISIVCFFAIAAPHHIPVLANVVPVLILMASRRFFKVGLLSPTAIVVLLFSLIGVLGFALSDDLGGVEGGGIRLAIDNDIRYKTALIFASTSLLILLGSLTVLFWRADNRQKRIVRFNLTPQYAPWLLILSAVPLLLVSFSIQGELLYRDKYLAGHGVSGMFGVGQQLAVASVAICGNMASSKNLYIRWMAISLGLIYFLTFFGLGSRRMALVPVVFIIGYIIARPYKTQYAVIFSGLASFLLLPLPLYLRGLQSHGLLPYLGSLLSFNFFETDWLITLNNILISYPITGVSAFGVNEIPISNLWIALNPLPGTLAGWYGISGSMTLNAWTPYSALGEVANYGFPVVAFVWISVGVLLAALELMMSSFLDRGYDAAAIMVFGLTGLFALQSLQYSLRPSLRMLLYALVLGLLVEAFTRGFLNSKHTRKINLIRKFSTS